MIYILFVLAVLSSIAVAGLISGSETAITSASKGYLYHLAKKGSKEAKQVLSLQENISETVGTILVMNQLLINLRLVYMLMVLQN